MKKVERYFYPAVFSALPGSFLSAGKPEKGGGGQNLAHPVFLLVLRVFQSVSPRPFAGKHSRQLRRISAALAAPGKRSRQSGAGPGHLSQSGRAVLFQVL